MRSSTASPPTANGLATQVTSTDSRISRRARRDRVRDLAVPAVGVIAAAPGTAIPEWRVERVDPEKMKLFAAIARDPNTIHWDRAEVARRGLGDRLINQGPTNLG